MTHYYIKVKQVNKLVVRGPSLVNFPQMKMNWMEIMKPADLHKVAFKGPSLHVL